MPTNSETETISQNAYYPRLDATGIYNSKYYYSENPFHQSGYGLPNCTCYAWGRFYEISDVRPSLPTGDAGTWLDDVKEASSYQTGDTPALGAVAVWGSSIGDAGHVAIVEQINDDGSYVISQSGYYRPIATYPPDTTNYFWTNTCSGETNKASWMSNYYFQGFIYNSNQPVPIPGGGQRKRKLPIWMMCKRKR